MKKRRSIVEIQAKQARKRQRGRRLLILSIMFIGVIFSTVAVLAVLNWQDTNAVTASQLETINENATLRETNINSALVEQEKEPKEDNVYWSLTKMNLLDVNLNRLRSINKETVGWIQLAGTKISYPYVQHSDNEYYLKHSFDGSRNSAGWIFLDSHNKTDLSNKNNILYAYSRLDNNMFGDLRGILDSGWLSNREHFVVRTATEGQNGIWQVFSIYHIEKEITDYLKNNFSSDSEYKQFLTKITRRSLYNFSSSPSTKDYILTLITSYNDIENMVLHAKLIKYN